MRNKKNKHLGIEIDPELHQKLHYIAKYEGAFRKRSDFVPDSPVYPGL